MKTVKTSIIFMLLIITTGLIWGQEYKTAAPNSKEGKLILKNFTGKLPITGYSGSEIVITSDAENLTPPEKAKGLKAIFPAGTDNTGLGLDVEKNGNEITINCLLPIGRDEEYQIKVPENLAIEIESGCERSNEIQITGMKNEIEIKNCHDINLKSVTGPLILSTIAGNIDITFNTINPDKPFSINSISGDIDITLPAKTSASLELKTVTGGFYSDFDFTDTQKNLKKVGGNELNFPLNGGGLKFSVVTVSGNIYLRKGN